MYLIGVELTEKTGFASIVLVQRVRKNLNKYYHVIHMKRFPFRDIGRAVVEDISKVYNDRKYTIRKPRFSQIGRPKKTVNEKPLIFVAYCDDTFEHIQYLKSIRIPAVCIFLNDENEWRTQVPGSCLKSDFHIPKNMLMSKILEVMEQDRLIMKKREDVKDLIKALNEYRQIKGTEIKTPYVNPFDDLILALAMPIWYYENLLSIRPRTP